MSSSVRHIVAVGSKWVTVATAIDAVVQILRLAILARFLDKTDFGIVAILSFVLGLTTVFGDMGFSVGIMSRKDISSAEFASVYWAQLSLYAFLFFVMSLCSPIFAAFYNENSIKVLMPISLLNLFFGGIGKLYDTVLQKNMLFKTIALRGIVSSFLALISAYIFCKFGFGIYSLILSTLVSVACNNIWNFIAGQYSVRLSFHFSLREVKPFFKIGIFKTGTQIIDYIANQLDILLVGKIMGLDTLGLYNIAKDFISRGSSMVQNINIKITLPLLAKVSDDIVLLGKYFKESVEMNTFIVIPICVGVILFPKEIILIFYGSKYLSAVNMMQLFALLFIVRSFCSPEGILVTAVGQTDLDFKWTIINLCMSAPVILLMSYVSVDMVIVGQILIGIITVFCIWKLIILKITKLHFKEYVGSFLKEIVSGSMVCVCLYWIIYCNVFNIQNLVIRLCVYVPFFLIVYLAVLYFVDKKRLFDFFSLVLNR